MRLPEAGTLIYCHDDPGACAAAETVAARRPDLLVRSYGTEPGADVIVKLAEKQAGSLSFRLGDQRYTLHVPGAHNALNATAAMLVVEELIRRGRGGDEASRPAGGPTAALGVAADRYAAVQSALAAFRGTRRRSEIVGGAAGVLVLDDYAHHPTAIRSTLTGFRSFYPGRRLIVSFMSHTYSRTLALLPDFADALALADVVILHNIYASAREANPGNVDGTVLADELQSRIGTGAIRAVHYVADPDEAVPLLDSILETGDLFVTMGAGNNWRLGVAWLEASAGGGE